MTISQAREYGVAELRLAAAAAIRAPSLHNSQPWTFRLRGGAIEVLAASGRLSAGDRSGWAARIAGGAAVFNARLALAALGAPALVRIRPDVTDATVIARLDPATSRLATSVEQDLFAAVACRRSNRAPFWPDPVPADLRARLVDAARAEGGWLDLLIGMTALGAFAEIAQSADRVLRRDPAYREELSHWADPGLADPGRADPGRAGVGVPALAAARAAEPQDLLPQRAYAGRPRAPGRDFEPEPLIAILGSAGDSAGDQIGAGQALQRVLLTATDAGLATSMISQPIEVAGAREQLQRSLGRSGTPQMAVRIGYGDPGAVTPRRPVDAVIVA
jgi:nitroreductase